METSTRTQHEHAECPKCAEMAACNAALLAALVDLTNLAPRCDFDDCGHVECISIKRAEKVIAQARGDA